MIPSREIVGWGLSVGLAFCLVMLVCVLVGIVGLLVKALGPVVFVPVAVAVAITPWIKRHLHDDV